MNGREKETELESKNAGQRRRKKVNGEEKKLSIRPTYNTRKGKRFNGEKK